MQLGMVGLGRMGANIVRRLMRDGHECVVYDHGPKAVETLVAEGAIGAGSLEELAAKLTGPRAVWVMVPAGEVTTSVITDLAGVLDAGDTIIDGGNTYYRDDLKHAEMLSERGIRLLDCGTSGGVWGLDRGYCLMIGGKTDAFTQVEPIFATLAPGVETAERTPGREGEITSAERGYLHCGPTGAGHFVKMVHNGIEYGMMASLAEGLNILHKADIGTEPRKAGDAETAPLAAPAVLPLRHRRRGGLRGVAPRQRYQLLAAGPHRSRTARVPGPGRIPQVSVSDSGEGRWTSIAAIEESVPAPVLTAALYSRFGSRHLDEFADKALSAMRKQFGGHDEKNEA